MASEAKLVRDELIEKARNESHKVMWHGPDGHGGFENWQVTCLDFATRALTAEHDLQRKVNALKEIANIKNRPYGGDWDEIEEAREIANKALGEQQ